MDDVDEDVTRIIATICELGRLSTLDVDQDFYDAGLSSLQALGLLVELETAFSISIPDTDFINARTPRALHEIILAQRSA